MPFQKSRAWFSVLENDSHIGRPMDRDFVRNWMWSEACEMLARAERLQRAFVAPSRAISREPVWEPPVDVLETECEILVFAVLPGVTAESLEVAADAGELIFAGIRTLPAELRTAVIHRLELPQGRFERRVRLPVGTYGVIRHRLVDGCLLITIEKEGKSRG
jgi:HSP20 family protein